MQDKRKAYREKHGKEMSSESSEEETDPEIKSVMAYEEVLKSRIFQADRLEKMEKALQQLELISKETNYCSDFEMAQFVDAMNNEDMQKALIAQLANDQEDIWFDLYRSITS